jgi:hypothetical protein
MLGDIYEGWSFFSSFRPIHPTHWRPLDQKAFQGCVLSGTSSSSDGTLLPVIGDDSRLAGPGNLRSTLVLYGVLYKIPGVESWRQGIACSQRGTAIGIGGSSVRGNLGSTVASVSFGNGGGSRGYVSM